MAEVKHGIAEKPCKVCGDPTQVCFNIKLKDTPICENCASSIALQQVQDLLWKDRVARKEAKKAAEAETRKGVCGDCGHTSDHVGAVCISCHRGIYENKEVLLEKALKALKEPKDK